MREPRSTDLQGQLWTYPEVLSILENRQADLFLRKWAWDWSSVSIFRGLSGLRVWSKRPFNNSDNGFAKSRLFEILEIVATGKLRYLVRRIERYLGLIDSAKAFQILQESLETSKNPDSVYADAAGLLAAYGDEGAKHFLMHGRTNSPGQISIWWQLAPEEWAETYEPKDLRRWSQPGYMWPLYRVNEPRLGRYIIKALSPYDADYVERSLKGLSRMGGGFRCIDPSQNDFDTFPDTSGERFGIESPLAGDEDILRLEKLITDEAWNDVSRAAFQSTEALLKDVGPMFESEARQLLAMASALRESQSNHPNWLVAEIALSLLLSIKHLWAAEILLDRGEDPSYILRAWQHVNGQAREKIERHLLKRRKELEPSSEARRRYDQRIREWSLERLRKWGRLSRDLSSSGAGLMPGLMQMARRHDLGDADLNRWVIESAMRVAIRAERHYVTPSKVRELLDMCPTVQRGVLSGLERENCHWVAEIIAERWCDFESCVRSFASDALYELADPAVYKIMKENYPNDDGSRDQKAMRRVELAYERKHRGAQPAQASLIEVS